MARPRAYSRSAPPGFHTWLDGADGSTTTALRPWGLTVAPVDRVRLPAPAVVMRLPHRPQMTSPCSRPATDSDEGRTVLVRVPVTFTRTTRGAEETTDQCGHRGAGAPAAAADGGVRGRAGRAPAEHGGAGRASSASSCGSARTSRGAWSPGKLKDEALQATNGPGDGARRMAQYRAAGRPSAGQTRCGEARWGYGMSSHQATSCR